MSVFMIMKVKGDPTQLETFARANADLMRGISAASVKAGATRHAFGGGDGEILVVDEWPDEASFQTFFASQTEIPRVMAGGGAQGAPEISFYRKLDTPDIL